MDWYPYKESIISVVINNGVTSIGDHAFQSYSNITSLSIPERVLSIGERSFYLCTNLANVTIPEGVETIDYEAFYKCSNLSSVSISKTVTSIGEYAFYECENLTDVLMPNNVTAIKSYAFGYDTGLTSIVIGNDVETIGYKIFISCSSLTEIVIPDSVTSIGNYAFNHCSILKYVYYAGSESEWSAIDIGSSNTYLTNATIYYNSNGPVNLSDLSVISYTYDGKAKEPVVSILGGSTTLVKGTDYTVSYSNNINVGIAIVTATAIGEGLYSGTVKKTFTISKVKNTIFASNITKSYSKKKQEFSIKATRKGNATLTYASNNSKISVNAKEKITVKKKYIGTATITIIASATKNYKKATKKITVTVGPAKLSISKLTAGFGSITVKWKKISPCDGYEIYVSGTYDFKNSTYSKKLKKNKITITGMGSGKTYSVKVRGYKKVGKKICYGPWSNILYTETK